MSTIVVLVGLIAVLRRGPGHALVRALSPPVFAYLSDLAVELVAALLELVGFTFELVSETAGVVLAHTGEVPHKRRLTHMIFTGQEH